MRQHVRCAYDKKRLFDFDPSKAIESFIEIKCPYCGTINIVQIVDGKFEVTVSSDGVDKK